MPLDRQFHAWLVEAAQHPLPDFSTGSVSDVRQWLDKENTRRTLPGSTYPVARIDNEVLAGETGAGIGLRWYIPRVHGSVASLPVVVFFHGGGFVIGSVENYDTLCRALCRASKTIVVSVEYRLAPEAPFPAATDDCLAALRHVHASAPHHGGDATRLAVAGDSAGGQLAAVTALRARDEEGPALMGQCLIYPQTDFTSTGTDSLDRHGVGYGLTRLARDWFVDQYLTSPDQALHRHVGLLQRTDLAGLPPALIVTAEFDPLVDEGEAYARRMAEAGVTVIASRYHGVIHGFMRRVGQHRLADQLIQQCGTWLRTALTLPD